MVPVAQVGILTAVAAWELARSPVPGWCGVCMADLVAAHVDLQWHVKVAGVAIAGAAGGVVLVLVMPLGVLWWRARGKVYGFFYERRVPPFSRLGCMAAASGCSEDGRSAGASVGGGLVAIEWRLGPAGLR